MTFPTSGVRMLLAQPWLEFAAPIQEPFALTEACTQRLSAALHAVIARCEALTPHIVLFPEFSLASVDAVVVLQKFLSISSNTAPLVVIGGLPGLTLAEYTRLCQLPNAHVDPCNAPTAVGTYSWVNTSVTLVRDPSSVVSIWIQPKVSPSWEETKTSHQSMFPGSSIRIFRARFSDGVPCRFLPLLCFDWIGREAGSTVTDLLLTGFNAKGQALGQPQSLHWAFVLQHNASPNHHAFLTSTKDFLTLASEYPYVERRDAAVVMVCTASSPRPGNGRGSGYGYSSLVFGPRAPFDTATCSPTFSTRSLTLRSSDALGTCRDVVFREMGQCIHCIDVRNPAYTTPDVTDRSLPLAQTWVFPLEESAAPDPRLPGAAVSPVVKWANDELDALPDIARVFVEPMDLEIPLRNAQSLCVTDHRVLPSSELARRIHSSVADRCLRDNPDMDPARDSDDWAQHERDGLYHIVHTLSWLRSVEPLEVANALYHGRHVANCVEVAAIRGSTIQVCLDAFRTMSRKTHSAILLVTRDADNTTPMPRELEDFADPLKNAGTRVLDTQTLVNRARQLSLTDYQSFVKEQLSVPDRRVI